MSGGDVAMSQSKQQLLRATVQEAQNTAICEGLCGAINERQNLMCLRYTDHDGECFRPDDIGLEKFDEDGMSEQWERRKTARA